MRDPTADRSAQALSFLPPRSRQWHERQGETIWPNDPDAYEGTSLYEKLEAYVPFTHEEIFAKKWGHS
jgi:hypothetical protein